MCESVYDHCHLGYVGCECMMVSRFARSISNVVYLALRLGVTGKIFIFQGLPPQLAEITETCHILSYIVIYC